MEIFKGKHREHWQKECTLLNILNDHLDQNIALDTDDWWSTGQLGKNYLAAGKLGHAYTFAMMAYGLRPCAATMIEAGLVLGAMGRYKDALDLYEEAHEAESKNVAAMNNAAQACLNLGDIKMAKVWLEKPKNVLTKEEYKRADTSHLERNWSFIHLAEGNYRKGWAAWDLGDGVDDRAARHEQLPKWKPGERGCIVAYGEQGLGDQLMFAECIYDLQQDAFEGLILEVDPRLVGLFKRSFPGVGVVGSLYQKTLGTVIPKNAKRISFGSLPGLYRPTAKSYRGHPYLMTCLDRKAMAFGLLNTLPHKKKIGISWTGGLPHNGAKERTQDLKHLMKAFSKLDADFISLEHTPIGTPEDHGVHVYPFLTHRELDYDYTAALISSLDLVVSVPNTVVHTAGAVGTQCLVLNSEAPSWSNTVMNMPLYKSVHTLNDWTPEYVAKKIKERLDVTEQLRRA